VFVALPAEDIGSHSDELDCLKGN